MVAFYYPECLLPHELYSSPIKISLAEAEHLIGRDLLGTINEFPDDQYYPPPQPTYYQKAEKRFLDALMAYQEAAKLLMDEFMAYQEASYEEVMTILQELAAYEQEQDKYEAFERSVDELIEYDGIMTKKLKKIVTRPDNERKDVVPRQLIEEEREPKKAVAKGEKEEEDDEEEEEEEAFGVYDKVYHAMKPGKKMRRRRHIVRRYSSRNQKF